MDKNEPFRAVAEKCIFGGDALLHDECGAVVMVKHVLPGEEFVCRITGAKKNFFRGEAMEMLQTSPERITPECEYFGRCPGCIYLDRTVEEEQREKLQQMHDFLRDFPECGIIPPAETMERFGYRNKLVLHVHKAGGETELGYIMADNTTVCDIAGCRLVHPKINEKLAGLRRDKGFWHSLHDNMDVTLRYNPGCDEVLVWRNAPPKNISWLREKTLFGEMAVPAGSFFQVNPQGMNELLKLVAAEIEREKPEVFIDLYCGSGLFGALAAGMKVKKVCGIELDSKAAEAAEYNLKQYSASAVIYSGDAAANLRTLLAGESGHKLLLLDPPRGGLGAGVIPMLRDSGTDSVIYISCNPATWRRDAISMRAAGFALKKAACINMFPGTEHFELFSVFERSGNMR